jgi:hypothetical protein
VASASTASSCMRSIVTDSGKGPTGKHKAVALSVIGGQPSMALPAPGPTVLWKRPSLALPTPALGRKNPKPVPVSTPATTRRLFATRAIPEVEAGGVVRALFHPAPSRESGRDRQMARKTVLKQVLEAARAAWESTELNLEAIEARA